MPGLVRALSGRKVRRFRRIFQMLRPLNSVHAIQWLRRALALGIKELKWVGEQR